MDPQATPKKKTCFVIMPILEAGRDGYQYFSNLYKLTLAPTLEHEGYDVKRADELVGGHIMEEIVKSISTSDLVIADLTDLNPNVYYELGVRHTLRGRGTIMIWNSDRSGLPFDLSAYRVIKFTNTQESFWQLTDALRTTIHEYETGDKSLRDNPVHFSLPQLQMDALAAASGTEAAELRQKIAALQNELQTYQTHFGLLNTAQRVWSADEIRQFIRDHKTPDEIITQADKAVQDGDKSKFIDIVDLALQPSPLPLTARQYRQLANLSGRLDLDPITAMIYNYGRNLYTSDSDLIESQLAYFAHSENADERETARVRIAEYIHLGVTPDQIIIPENFSSDNFGLLGILLDAYHADDLNTDALHIAEAFQDRFPNRTLFMRNYGRALERIGRKDDALKYYQRALWCPDWDDTTATWLGNEFYNRDRNVDAVEAYLKACLKDPTDANGFSHVADALAYAFEGEAAARITHATYAFRTIPPGVSASVVAINIFAALSCELLSEESVRRSNRAATRMGFDWHEIAAARQGQHTFTLDSFTFKGQLDRLNRLKLASDLYDKFRSPITDEALNRAQGGQ